MKKYKCPCCDYFTFESDSGDGPLFDFCDVCSWQYDPVAHNKPDTIKGANKITLNQAKLNFQIYGVSNPKNKISVRKPLAEEYPENN
jgi:hypothetical protein